MITLKNIRVKGDLIYCDMYQDRSRDAVKLVFKVDSKNEIKLVKIITKYPNQKVYLENYAESCIRNYIQKDELENLRSYGKRCWC